MVTGHASRSPWMLPALCRISAAVGLVLSVCSCGGTKPNLRLVPDASFTRASLGQGHIAVAGVTSKLGSEIDRATVRNQLAGILAGTLEFEITGLRVMSVDVARSRLGRVRHARLLADLEETGGVSAAAIAQLDSTIGADVRYAVVARIETEEVERHEGTGTPTDYSTGKPDTDSGDEVERSTKRILSVSFLVYELSNGRAVWEELIRGSDEDTATHSPDGKRTIYPPYPKVPKVEGAFDDACRTLSMHLAKPPK